jgi:hypothetical protein
MVGLRKRFAGEHILCHGDGVPAVYMGVNIVIHHDRRRLVAAAEARNVTDRNFFRVRALKGGIESGTDLIPSAKMAAHVGADANVHLRWRIEMKVGIKAGYGMDLTNRDTDVRSEGLELFGGQVAEIALYGPQFFKHDSGHSASVGEVKPYFKMARAQMLQQIGFRV